MLTPSEFRMIPFFGQIVIAFLIILAVLMFLLRYSEEIERFLFWLQRMAKWGKK